MIRAVIADTSGLLRALARTPTGQPSFPDYQRILTSAAAVVVPGLVLAEVDYFLRATARPCAGWWLRSSIQNLAWGL